MSVTIRAINVYPVKSCRGIARDEARVDATGLADDRHWMMVRPNGRFVTQRELPRMALIETHVDAGGLTLRAPGVAPLAVGRAASGDALDVTVWKFTGRGIDCGEAAAAWCTGYLGTPLRLVRFDPVTPRECSPEWTQGVRATTEFADGFPILVISLASLADLNSRLGVALPMERFRPNIVIDGVAAYDEDRMHELRGNGVELRMVKPCTRCSITTTDQRTGALDGVEPLASLKTYRYDRDLKGVLFGQNAIVAGGAGGTLRVGQTLESSWK
jgi:uncharacterized protein YcbX